MIHCASAGRANFRAVRGKRVAIGRALVRDVDVFLFDEPLSNLDAKLRTELRVEFEAPACRARLDTMIYVTHDQIEALTLADRIAVMSGGCHPAVRLAEGNLLVGRSTASSPDSSVHRQ